MKASKRELQNKKRLGSCLKAKKNQWKEYKECHDWSIAYFDGEKTLPF